MEATGWSWPELMGTPIDVVKKHQLYLLVKAARESGGSMFNDDK